MSSELLASAYDVLSAPANGLLGRAGDQGGGDLPSPTAIGNLSTWYDVGDSDSLIYDSSDKVILVSDKSGNSGAGTGKSTALFLPGTSGSYASAPNRTEYNVTGDAEWVINLAADNWTPASLNSLFARYQSAGNRQWLIYLRTTGALQLSVSFDGTAVENVISSSTLSFTNMTFGWVKITRSSSTGGVNFYHGTDGVSWTILGVEQSTTSGAMFASGTSQMEIGAANGGVSPSNAKYKRAIFKNGIDGTTVFDANFVGQRTNAASFTESSTNAATVTINGSAQLGWVDDGNCLVLPGVAGNSASTPDSSALDIIGDIELRIKCALVDYTPAASQSFLAKWAAAGQSTFQFRLNTGTNVPTFFWTEDGSTNKSMSATVAPTVADLSTLSFKFTLDVDNGVGDANGKFYTSTDWNGTAGDAGTWTQLGATVSLGTTTSIHSGTASLFVGSVDASSLPLNGNIYNAQVYNGIAGTLVFDADFTRVPKLATSFTEFSTNAATVTINQTAIALPARIHGARDLYMGTAASQPTYLPWEGSNYGYLNGVSGNYFSTPDSAVFNPSDDVEIIWHGKLPVYNDGTSRYLGGKYRLSSTGRGYSMAILNTGKITARFSTTGSGIDSEWTSDSSITIPDNAEGWIKASRIAATDVRVISTSTDGINWSVVICSSLSSQTGALYESTAGVSVGALDSGLYPLVGSTFDFTIKDGVNGAVLGRFDASDYPTAGGSTLVSSATGETYTINGGAKIVTRTGLYFDGSADYMKSAAFALSQPENVYFVGEQVTWGSKTIYDGGSVLYSMALTQRTSTPNLAIRTPVNALGLISLALSTPSVVAGIFNGSGSSERIDRETASTGTLGANSAQGFTLGQSATGTLSSNIFVSEILIADTTAHDTATQDRIALYEGQKWGINV